MYYLNNGDETTKEEIKKAFELGKARFIHSYGDGRTETSLSLNGQDFDTRGQNEMMAEDAWTRTPETLKSCYEAAWAGF